MAIIYTYPEINEIEGEDLLLISDTSLYKRPTRSVTIDNLATYIGTVIGIGFWNLGTAPDSIFTTKITSIGQDANIASSKLNVYKTDDMTASVPHVATFNESLSNHSANLWPSPGNNSADIHGSVSRASFTGSGTVDQVMGSNPVGRHSGSGSVNFIQGTQSTANLTGSGSAGALVASYSRAIVKGTSSVNIPTVIGSWNVAEIDGLNDVDNIYGTYSNVILKSGDVNDDAIGNYINFDQVSADTEINNAYYIHAKNDSLSVTGEKFFIKDETGIPSQFSNKLVLNAYGSGSFTGTATQRLAVDTNGNVIEIPIGSGPVDGSGTANYTARWTDSDTLGIGALYDNGTNVGIGTSSPGAKLDVNGTTYLRSVALDTIFGYSGNNIAFTNAGNTTFNNSNVGIGTTSPANKLHIEGGNIQLSDNQHITWGYGGNNAIYGNNTNDFIKIFTNGAERLIVNSSGNVGIGTTSPSQKLEVAGNILTGGGSLNKTIGFKRTDGFNLDLAKIISNGEIRIGGTNVGVITFNRSSDEVMRIASNGNVGIGTTSPSANLHVSKGTTNTYPAPSTNADLLILENRNAGNSVGGGMTIFTDNGGRGNIYFGDEQSNQVAGITCDNMNGKTDLFFTTNGNNERLRIDGNGNVGIGTTNPSEKLDVRGNIHLEEAFPSIIFKRDTSGLQEYSIKNEGNFTIEKTTLDSGGSFIIKDENGRTPLNVSMGLLNPDTVISGDLFVKDKDGLTTKLYVNNGNGNVGIGTTSPDSLLEISTTDTTKNFIKLTSGGGSVNPSLIFEKSTVEQGVIQYIRNGDLKIYNTDSDGGVMISGSGATNYDMYINNSGNVGIGTTSPQEKLDISAGNIRLDDNQRISWSSSDSNIGRVRITGNEPGNFITIATGNSDRVRINNTGVGIGTTSPSEKLDVWGNIRLRTSEGNTTNKLIPINYSGNSALKIKGGNYVHRLFFETDWNDFEYASIQSSYNTSESFFNLNKSNSTGGVSGTTRISTGNSYFNGNVGIGTINPSTKLEVISATNEEGIAIKDASGNLKYKVRQFGGNTYSSFWNSSHTEQVRINSSGTSYFNGGNVGIGTTSPGKKLEVNGTFKATGDASIDGTGNLTIRNQSATGSGVVFIDNVWQGGIEHISGNLYFRAGGQVDRMTIKTGGNVGIGTTNPQALLNIESTTAPTLRISNGGGTSPSPKLEFYRQPGVSSYIQYDVANKILATDNAHASGVINYKINGSEKMRISSNGNVGIGNTNPTAKLDVNGDIRIQGENQLYLGGSTSVPNWEITASGSDLIVNDTGTNVGSVLFNNDEGVALPRLTTTQINAISSPTQGLMAYNTTLNTLCFYNGSSWQKVSHTSM